MPFTKPLYVKVLDQGGEWAKYDFAVSGSVATLMDS
jgi:hypothetical protein